MKDAIQRYLPNSQELPYIVLQWMKGNYDASKMTATEYCQKYEEAMSQIRDSFPPSRVI